MNLLCAAKTFSAADRLAATAGAALREVVSAEVLGARVTVFQDGHDTGTA